MTAEDGKRESAPEANRSEPRIGAVVLAAGRSQRMGRLKPLLPFGDRPMLARVVETLEKSGEFSPILVVTGYAQQEIVRAIKEYTAIIAHNPNYEAGGMLSSVQTGVRALPEEGEAFVLALGDQPMVEPETLVALVQCWRETQAPLVLPTYAGRRGHPVLFAAARRPEILALPPDSSLKAIVTRYAAEAQLVAVSDESVLMDVDTPEDYARALQRWERRGAG